MITEMEIEIANKLVRMHDGNSYKLIQELSLPPENSEDTSNVSEEIYKELCTELQQENGELESLELIDCLLREKSKLTLWNAKYSNSNYKVFWAFCFDLNQNKVREILVQW